MSQQPSGWYDDPSDPDMLRYWDGVSWTSHTAPKKSPTASQSTIGLPQQSQVPPDAGSTQGVPTPTTPMPQGSGWQTPAQQSPQQYQQGYPPYQQAPQYPNAQNAQWMHNLRTTADGIPLASWGKRFGAWLIDGVILFVVVVLLWRALAPEVWTEFQRVMDIAQTGDQAAVQDAMQEWTSTVTGAAVKVGIAQFLVVFLYCLAFWTTTGQTPGKMVVGISVRRVDRPGPLDLGTAVRRRLLSALQIVPFIGGLYGLIAILDGLWPLWDDQRQALHDKIAATQVVEGKQPRTPS